MSKNKKKVYVAWCPKKNTGFMQIGDIRRYRWEVEYSIRTLKINDYKPVKVYISETDPRKAKG